MRTAAFYALLLLWVLWALPFLIRRTRGKSTRRAKTARISILGMAFQTASYPLVSSTHYFRTHELEMWRVLAAGALGRVGANPDLVRAAGARQASGGSKLESTKIIA